MNSNAHTNVEGFLKLVSLTHKLNKPISSSTLDKLSYLGILPSIELEVPVLDSVTDLDPS